MNNLLLRGCTLKNTIKILGIVIYTGHTTKVMMNSLGYRSKQSKVFKQLNYFIYGVFTFLFLISFTIGIVQLYLLKDIET